MKLRFAVVSTLVAALLLDAIAFVRVAEAQVPPHYPGTICFTPQFWCWAQPPAPPGTQCACLGPYGFVAGIRG